MPGAWAPIRAQLHIKDDAAFEVYRRRFVEGIAKRSIAEEAADARTLFHSLLEVGGKDLVGDVKELDTSLYYDASAGE